MTRVSVKEAYSNRDLIAQIARLKTYVEQGTFKEVSATYSGGVLVLTFTAFDDSTQSFNIPMDSIVGLTGTQVGNTVTLHVEFASGTVVDIPYTIANADTSPTPDTLGLRDANAYLSAATNPTGTRDNVLTTGTRVQNDLDAYATMVRTVNAQTIAGVKTCTSNPIIQNSTYASIDFKSARTTGDLGGISFYDGNGTLKVYQNYRGGDDANARSMININSSDAIRFYKDHTEIPNNRAYNSANTTDVATITTLDAYTPMVRTTGNQTIAGTKSIGTGGAIEFLTSQIQNRLKIKDTGLTQGTLVGEYVNLVTLRDNADNEVLTLRYEEDTGTNTMKLVAIFNDGTQHKITLASYTLP